MDFGWRGWGRLQSLEPASKLDLSRHSGQLSKFLLTYLWGVDIEVVILH
jgi:hypothetical protein